jgi:hydrogenase maturation protease
MARETASGILIVGVGTADRGDDAAGLAAVRLLKESGLGSAMFLEHSRDGAALLESWKNAHAVILIDAVCSGARPGTIHRFDASARPLPALAFRHSTHAFSVAEAIEMARALGQLPPSFVVYGIEGKNFAVGDAISPEVASAVRAAAQQVSEETCLSGQKSSPRKRV